MQCLFCGKELALLKRLRGGAEFCSEAHRKEYQEQYEQLALARLMQANPRSEPGAPLERPSAPLPSAADLASRVSRQSAPAEMPDPEWQGSEVHLSPSVMVAETPESSAQAEWEPSEETGPAPLAGFLSEPLVPAVTLFEQAGELEAESISGRAATPSWPPYASTLESLAAAPRVSIELGVRALDYHIRQSERAADVREFTGVAPIVELNLRPDTGTEPAGAADVMEIVMLPHPPQKAKPWLEVPRGFPATPAELGELARLDFRSTGFGDSGTAYSDSPATAVPTPAAPGVDTPVLAPVEPPALARSAPPEVVAPKQVIPEQVIPEIVTKVLPVTLHGVAAPRGKLTQPFASAIAGAVDVQTPPSMALPLRPAIVFGPAPAAPAAPVPPKPAQAALAQPQARQANVPPPKAPPANATPAKADERSKSPAAPAPKAVPVKQAPEAPAPEKVQAKSAPKVPAPAVPPPAPAPRVEPRVEARVEQRVETHASRRDEWNAPRPFETSSASDSAGPNLDTGESTWSRLSTGLKIGVAAAVVLGISGIAFLVTHGTKAASEKPATAPAPIVSSVAAGVPISGGWIDDWANSAKTNRHISMLSGSVKLSDYRLEFQSQIETKAIGWAFRALNPRNYYVAKLEIVKAGLDPTIALVHFAVVDGQDESRVSVPLPMKVRVDTNYKIRFDAVGNHFTAWVLDQKIAEWTDSRFGSGGVGFFSERDEKAALQGTVNVVALVPKN